jgi:hypothetical protein
MDVSDSEKDLQGPSGPKETMESGPANSERRFPKPLDPEKLIRVLADHETKYVLVGALAARLQGFPRLTADADITPAPDDENLVRLARALRTLDARVFTEGVPEGLDFDCSPQTLARAEMWNLVTEAGRLDIIFRPAGTEGYEDLARDAVAFSVFGVGIAVASLEDIIRTKEAADRPQDRQDVAILREMVRGRETG